MTWLRSPAAPRADEISRDPTGGQASQRGRASQPLESAAVIAEAPAAAAPTARQRRDALLALTSLHPINDFYGLLIPPLLPALRAAFDLSYTQAGAIPFVSTGVSALLQPTLGYVADRRLARRAFMAGG